MVRSESGERFAMNARALRDHGKRQAAKYCCEETSDGDASEEWFGVVRVWENAGTDEVANCRTVWDSDLGRTTPLSGLCRFDRKCSL